MDERERESACMCVYGFATMICTVVYTRPSTAIYVVHTFGTVATNQCNARQAITGTVFQDLRKLHSLAVSHNTHEQFEFTHHVVSHLLLLSRASTEDVSFIFKFQIFLSTRFHNSSSLLSTDRTCRSNSLHFPLHFSISRRTAGRCLALLLLLQLLNACATDRL